MSRPLSALVALLFALGATAQPKPETDPEKVPPQAVVNVRKLALGPDMVDITIASKGYPLDLLSQQCGKLAQLLGSDARGLQVSLSGYDPKFKFAKASFATDGLIDRDKGEVRLEAIVKALVDGQGSWRLRSFLVTLDGEAPVEKQTLKSFQSEAVVLKAHVSESPKGIEYRILALTDDPTKIKIPVRHESAKPQEQKASRGASTEANWLPLALVGVAGLAAGLLVYSALSARSSKPKGRTDQRT